MATVLREFRTMDKAKWGDGPWQQEPDKVQWIDEATELDCLIVRNHMGALCGYVGLPPQHPLHGVEYQDAPDLDVHGGLTFSDHCQEGAEEDGICHIPAEGRPANVWWLGFDCAHCFDLSPATEARLPAHLRDQREVYRDRAYVEAECAKLAAQLKAVDALPPPPDPSAALQEIEDLTEAEEIELNRQLRERED
jgi:hypothetical protein